MSATAFGDHGDRVEARQRRRRLSTGLLRLASDERLVELLRDGSEPAFEALFARHHRGVLSFCRHMLGSAEEAEDAVQHTFLAAYRDIAGTSKEIHLRPWLYAIARNRCLTVLRARREQADAESFDPSTEHLSTEVERRHELRTLLGDLAALPDEQRAALVLAELGDMSHDEIGQALGCPREKVKALVFQARSSLIASRDAREAPCEEIREQLSNLRGGALRRNVLRRHLRDCAGCREFRDKVRIQRRELALILPVAPSLGLKAAVLGGGAAATSSVVAKTAVVLAVAGGGVAAVEEARERPREQAAQPAVAAPAAASGGAAPVSGTARGRDAPEAVRVDSLGVLRGDVREHRSRGERRAGQDRGRGGERGRGVDGRRGHGRVPGEDGGRGPDGAGGLALGLEKALGRALGRGKDPAPGRGVGRGGGSGRGAERGRAPKTVKVKAVKVKPDRPAKPPNPTTPPKRAAPLPAAAEAPPPAAAPPAEAPPAEAPPAEAPPAATAPAAEPLVEKGPKAEKSPA